MRRVAVAAAIALAAGTAFFLAVDTDAGLSVNPNDVEDPAIVGEAEELYGTENATVHSANDSAFQEAFPDHELYIVRDHDLAPPTRHAMAYDPGTGEGLDLTLGYNDLLADYDLLIDTEGKALRYAQAHAHLANAELQLFREMVNSSDEAHLGTQVDDPVVESTVDGWRVLLQTWTPENGILAAWEIELTETQVFESTMWVDELATGDHDKDWQFKTFRNDTEVENLYDGVTGAHESTNAYRDTDDGRVELRLPSDVSSLTWSTVATNTSFDNTTWEIQANGTHPSQQLVEALEHAGPWSYAKFVSSSHTRCANAENPDPSWGLASNDGDCTFQVRVLPQDTLFCGSCLAYDADNLTIYVAPGIHSWLEDSVQWYPSGHPYDVNDTVKLALGHQHLVKLASRNVSELPAANPTGDPGEIWGENNTLLVEEFPLRSLYTPMYDALYQEFRQKGALTIEPATDGSNTLNVTDASPPSTWNETLLPTDWTVDFQEPPGNVTNTTVPPLLDDGENYTVEDYPLDLSALPKQKVVLSKVNPAAVEAPDTSDWTDLRQANMTQIAGEIAQAEGLTLDANECSPLGTPSFEDALANLSAALGVENSVNTSANMSQELEDHAARITNCMAAHVNDTGYDPDTDGYPPSTTQRSTWLSILRDLLSEVNDVPTDLTVQDSQQCLDDRCWIQTGSGVTYTEPALLVIDTGSSTYENNAGGASGTCPEYPALAVVVDLWGNDTYVPEKTGGECFPTIGAGAYGGVGILADWGGDDYYEGLGTTMGAGYAGVGYLNASGASVADPGEDVFHSPHPDADGDPMPVKGQSHKMVAGAATHGGIGILDSEKSLSVKQHGVASAGYGGAGGTGVLINRGGSASIEVEPAPSDMAVVSDVCCVNVSGTSMGTGEVGGSGILLDGGSAGQSDLFACRGDFLYGCIGSSSYLSLWPGKPGNLGLFSNAAGAAAYTIEGPVISRADGDFTPTGVGAAGVAGRAVFEDGGGDDQYATPSDGQREDGTGCGYGAGAGLGFATDTFGNDTWSCAGTAFVGAKEDTNRWADGLFQLGVGVGSDRGALAPQPVDADSPYREDFDDGVANGWATSGLWHVDDACNDPPSDPTYLGYHVPGVCTYNTGTGGNWGSAELALSLADASEANVSFQHAFDVDGGRDDRRLQVSTDEGRSWEHLWAWSDGSQDWTHESFSLDPWAGQTILLRWYFEAEDGIDNDNPGWHIDDVEVRWS